MIEVMTISPDIVAKAKAKIQEAEQERMLKKAMEPKCNKIALTESELDSLDEVIDILEERDYLTSAKVIQDLIDIYNRSIE